MKKSEQVDRYIERFPKNVQALLKKMRVTIQKAAPGATETISYGIPAYALDRMLVWFAAHANHIGFYPGASGTRAFKKELSVFRSGKGSVQFPFDEPLPVGLVSRVVKFRVKERAAKRVI